MIDESVTALSAAVEDPSDGINEMLSTVGLITFLSFSHYSYVTYAFTSLSLSLSLRLIPCQKTLLILRRLFKKSPKITRYHYQRKVREANRFLIKCQECSQCTMYDDSIQHVCVCCIM